MKKSLLAISLVMLLSCSKKTTAPAATATPAEARGNTEVAAAASAEAQGQKIYTAQCGRCHELHRPDEYTVGQWKPILHRMADKAKLSPEEKLQVMTYLSHQARSVK